MRDSIQIYKCDFSPEWRETFKKIDHNEPHIIAEVIHEGANIWDFTYYTGDECICIETIDMTTTDRELMKAEWQGTKWGRIMNPEKHIERITDVIMEFYKQGRGEGEWK